MRWGADDKAHSQIGLIAHLIATWEILRRWNQPEYVCDAGLFHSIYGSTAYSDATIPFTQRHTVRALIGEPAEVLCYSFCRLDRRLFFESAIAGDMILVDRVDGEKLALQHEGVIQLSHMMLANWIEQRNRVPMALRLVKDLEYQCLSPLLQRPAHHSLVELIS